jgi:hypothetical protein
VDRRTRNLLALLFATIVAVTAGAALLLSETTTPNSDAPPGTTAVTGVIVAVDSLGLGDVRGFTLRREGGELIDFDLRALESGTEFPPGHLAEHQATAEPVRVWYRDEAGVRLAIRLEDAPR